VLHRHEVAGCLKEAVGLYELAHRPENARCPQSVCTVQDLAATYGDLDGPGYADERIAVARENLAAIDPSWPCFDCISGELAEALHDAGRDGEVLEFVETQRKAMIAAGSFDNTGNLPRARAEALIALGRFDEALEQLDAYDPSAGGEHAILYKRLIEARALFGAGQLERGREIMPPPSAVLDTPGLYQAWLEAFEALTSPEGARRARRGRATMSERGDEPNSWRAGQLVRAMQARLDKNGARYLSTLFATAGAELASRRDAREIARLMIDEARRQLPELRAPEGLAARLDAVTAELEGGDADPLAGVDDAESVRELFGDDPEVVLEVVRAAEDRWPGDSTWVEERAYALLACGFEELAESALRQRIAAHPDSIGAVRALAETLFESGRHGELRELVTDLPVAGEPEVRWIIARTLAADGERDACVDILETLRDAPPAALMLATLRRDAGELDAALEILEELIAAVKEPGPWDWERMVAGTLAGRWAAVRDSASRVGMDLPGDGPIELQGSLCQIMAPAGDGREVPIYGVRTGPVTARVVQILGPDAGVERYGDLLVFDADELNPLAEGEPDDDHVPVYRMIAELESAGYESFAIDGPHPGDAAIDALRDALESRGVELQVKSDGAYRVLDGERDSAELPGVYAFIAVPPDRGAAEVTELLADLTSVWRLPVAWTELAAAAGDDAAVERHEAIEERFSL
jgi:tetratricopeptide (TPR) repeat protein